MANILTEAAVRKSRLIPAGLALLLAVFAACYLYIESKDPQPTIDLRYAYLLVSVEAGPDWSEKHKVTIEWNDREVQLPIVFRYRVSEGRMPEWGGVPDEAKQALMIQGLEIPVRVGPPTTILVFNEPHFGLIPETSKPPEKTFSIANWVSVGPPERLSMTPAGKGDPQHTNGLSVAKRVELRIAEGKVIDVENTR